MSPELRQQVRERAAGRCEYCLLPDRIELTGPFHVEHIIARQHRGVDELSNLAWACSRCNRHKGTNNHFEIVGALIRGKSPVGRPTAQLLQMNAERRVELRFELINEGLWQA